MELSYNMVLTRPFPKEKMRFLMVGLDGAGKTTILYQMLKLKEIVTTIPTMSFETDASYFRNTHGLIFVVDSSDRHRVLEAKVKLHSILNRDELRDTMLLVFANKQDILHAMETAEIIERLDLSSLHQQIRHVQMTHAVLGEGLKQGLQCLSNNIAFKDFSKIIEVKTDGAHLGYIWAPAKFNKENEDENIHVEFLTDHKNFNKKSSLGTWSLSSPAYINFSKIRPSPPPFVVRVYSLADKVDALLECGWCEGVISKVHVGRRYSVCLGLTGQEKYFHYWQLRPCMMWKDSKWQTDEEKGFCKEHSHYAVEQDEISKLLSLLFLGNLFARQDERDFCYGEFITDGDSSVCLKDLETISRLSSMISEPDTKLVYKEVALNKCSNYARQWVNNSEEKIENSDMSYAALILKMNKILASTYFKCASMQHVIDYPNYRKARTKVFWDIENTPVGDVDPVHIWSNIKSVLRKLGLEGPVEILAIGDQHKGSGKHWHTLRHSGIELRHVDQNGEKDVADKAIMAAMMVWAFPGFTKYETPGNMVLISGDSDYTQTLRELRKRRFQVILAHRKDSKKQLKWTAKKYMLWEDLRKGHVPIELIEDQDLFWKDSSEGVTTL